jgi:hypothetical protein
MTTCFIATLAGAAAIDAGMHTLAPNMPGQQVRIHVTGGEAVSGIDFFVQIGDGGAAVGGSDTGPKITSVDLETGTIFDMNNTGIFTDPTPLLWGATTTSASGTVAANGLLATLTIDTTGFANGQYNLILNPLSTGPTAFAGLTVTTNLSNGWLQIGAPPNTPGDYNRNGVVDAADYVVWRDTLTQSGTGLAADGTGNNLIDAADYDVWRAHFGRAVGNGSSTAIAPEIERTTVSTNIPEPATFVSALTLLIGILFCRVPNSCRE